MAYGGKAFTEKRVEAARARFAGPVDFLRFFVGLAVIIGGASLVPSMRRSNA